MSPPTIRPKLTDATLAGLRCPPGRKDALVFDSVEPGFGVRVTADGKWVFLFQYRLGKAVRRLRIGVWGEGSLTASKARKEAERLRGMVHNGQDPVGDRKVAEAATNAAERLAREKAVADAYTLRLLIDGWEEKGLAHRKPSYVTDATARLRAYFADKMDRPAASITKAEAIQAIDAIERKRGTTSARRGLAYARAAYSWAEQRDLLENNPFRGVAPPGKENPRDRVLSDEEIGAIWRAALDVGGAAGDYVRTLLLTLQRREEVAGMQWQELAQDLSIWTIPAERAKNGKAHLVHLAPAARAIIRAQPKRAGSPLVFQSSRKGQLRGFSHMKDALTAAMNAEKAGPGMETNSRPKSPPTAADWRFHDFRRTGVTVLANSGIPPHVADKLLNHVTGSIQGVAAVYQRAEFLPERKAAIELWAAQVVACAESAASVGAKESKPAAAGC